MEYVFPSPGQIHLPNLQPCYRLLLLGWQSSTERKRGRVAQCGDENVLCFIHRTRSAVSAIRGTVIPRITPLKGAYLAFFAP